MASPFSSAQGPRGIPDFGGDIRLGILKGGQLGRMLLQPCLRFGIHPHVMDDDPEAPCSRHCRDFVVGDASDFSDVVNFGRSVDLITLEFEHVNTDALDRLVEEGIPVHPAPEVLRVIQDKGRQKEFYRQNGIPTADYVLTETREDLRHLTEYLPGVQKLRTAGYDGRGIKQLKSSADIDQAFDAPSVLEKRIDIAKEIAVIVGRNLNGETTVYPAAEMVFHGEANLLDYLFSPAEISPDMEARARDLALGVTECLGLVGLLAVEMFVTHDQKLLVNEVAPRTHNSGHHTIEANRTSQFEQHLRAVLNLPFGKTDLREPAVMVNLIGEAGHEGPARYKGLTEVLSWDGVYLHRYGKQITRPFRKMGHITVVNESLDRARAMAAEIKRKVRVVA